MPVVPTFWLHAQAQISLVLPTWTKVSRIYSRRVWPTQKLNIEVALYLSTYRVISNEDTFYEDLPRLLRTVHGLQEGHFRIRRRTFTSSNSYKNINVYSNAMFSVSPCCCCYDKSKLNVPLQALEQVQQHMEYSVNGNPHVEGQILL